MDDSGRGIDAEVDGIGGTGGISTVLFRCSAPLPELWGRMRRLTEGE